MWPLLMPTFLLFGSERPNCIRYLKDSRLPIYINKVYLLVLCSFCKKRKKVAIFVDIFLKKACVLLIFFIPLHPLSGTKLS